jgi:hypothetical protein
MYKLIKIIPVYNNFCRTDEKSLKDKKSCNKPTTAAQRVGITNRIYTAHGILSFSVNREYFVLYNK